MNHPKFREQDHNKEAEVEEKQAEAVGLAESETLKWDRDQREDQAEAQGAGQHPHQQSIWLQLWGKQRWFSTHHGNCLGHRHHTGGLLRGSRHTSMGSAMWDSKFVVTNFQAPKAGGMLPGYFHSHQFGLFFLAPCAGMTGMHPHTLF